jgi:hypothetical protein
MKMGAVESEGGAVWELLSLLSQDTRAALAPNSPKAGEMSTGARAAEPVTWEEVTALGPARGLVLGLVKRPARSSSLSLVVVKGAWA